MRSHGLWVYYTVTEYFYCNPLIVLNIFPKQLVIPNAAVIHVSINFSTVNCMFQLPLSLQFLFSLVVGNKVDLPKRDVSTKDGNDKARQFNTPYVETSAKTKQGVVSSCYSDSLTPG